MWCQKTLIHIYISILRNKARTREKNKPLSQEPGQFLVR